MEFPSGRLPEPKLWMDWFPGWQRTVATKPELPRQSFFRGGFRRHTAVQGGVSFGSYNQKSANCHLDRGFRKNWLTSIHPRMARVSPCIISIQHASLETSHHKGFSIQRQAPLDPLTSRCKNLTSKIQPTLRPADQLQAMMRRRFFFGHILLALRI